MTKESCVRKCSHCGHNGHNLRTCNGKGCFKLFGVKIDINNNNNNNASKEDESTSSIRKSSNGGGGGEKREEEESIRKSKSMGNLLLPSNSDHRDGDATAAGYLSDGFIQSERPKNAHERKKGVPWTEDEHRLFLLGLKNLGKGDWRGISKNYVPSRTPTQVASHAQKYFIRKTTTEKKKRRSSVFDMAFREQSPPPQASPALPSNKASEITQQVSNSSVSPVKNTTEIKGQASSSTHAVTSEKPPLSPVARNYGIQIPDFRHMPYMMGMPRNVQNLPAADSLPTVSFVPVMNYKPMMNYPNAGYVYIPSNSHGNFATCAPFMTQPSSGLLAQLHPQGEPPVGPPTSVTKKGGGLEVSIGALSI
ncbi:hypothetical protein LguiA_034705 [Lonicera macranthoides]